MWGVGVETHIRPVVLICKLKLNYRNGNGNNSSIMTLFFPDIQAKLKAKLSLINYQITSKIKDVIVEIRATYLKNAIKVEHSKKKLSLSKTCACFRFYRCHHLKMVVKLLKLTVYDFSQSRFIPHSCIHYGFILCTQIA